MRAYYATSAPKPCVQYAKENRYINFNLIALSKFGRSSYRSTHRLMNLTSVCKRILFLNVLLSMFIIQGHFGINIAFTNL